MRHFEVNSMPPARYEIVVPSAGPSVEPVGRCMEIARLRCALRTTRDGSRASRSSRPISCAMPRSCSQMGRSRRKPRSRWRRGRSPRRSPAELEHSRVSAARSPTSPWRRASIAIPHDRAGRRPRPAGGLLAGHWPVGAHRIPSPLPACLREMWPCSNSHRTESTCVTWRSRGVTPSSVRVRLSSDVTG